MRLKRQAIITIIILTTVIGLYFTIGNNLYQLICTQYTYSKCVHQSYKCQTCYDTCTKQVEHNYYDAVGPQVKTAHVDYSSQCTKDLFSADCSKGWTSNGKTYTLTGVDWSCSYGSNPYNNANCKCEYYCDYKVTYYTTKSYECNPHDCNCKQYCDKWVEVNSTTKPAESDTIKDIRCSKQEETCGNGICEPQYGEDYKNCVADCGKCNGKNIDDGNPCTQDVCDQATGEVKHIPIQSEECLCKNVKVDDGNPCTIDSCHLVNGNIVVSHKPIKDCKSSQQTNEPLIYGLASLFGIGLAFGVYKSLKR